MGEKKKKEKRNFKGRKPTIRAKKKSSWAWSRRAKLPQGKKKVVVEATRWQSPNQRGKGYEKQEKKTRRSTP